MHSIFKINEIKSPQILIRHLLPFSCIRDEVVDTGVDGSSEKLKRKFQIGLRKNKRVDGTNTKIIWQLSK